MELSNYGLKELGRTERVCDKHGAYTEIEYNKFTQGCRGCFEDQRKQSDIEDQKRWEAERNQRIADNLLRRAAIPPRFGDRRLSNYIVSDDRQGKALATANEFVASFADNPGRSLIFCGGVGSGKTHLSVGIALDLMDRHHICVFTSVIGAIRSVKETYARGSETSEREALDKLIEPALLILDEVGVQFGSEAEKMILFEIINGRYENMKSTIVISNLAIDPLTTYLGERVVDRLREGGGKLIVFDWPSYRRQAA